MKSIIPLLVFFLGISAQADVKTLLEMSNAKIEINPDKTAIVLIDYQNEYALGTLPLYQMESVLKESVRILNWAREKKIPVVHVLHQGQKGGLFDPFTKAGQEISEMKSIKGEKMVAKNYPNAFFGTDLADYLKKAKLDSVVIVGLMTHMCVEASVRAAHELGLKAAVVASATTTRDLKSTDGETIKAEIVKRASLASIADLVGAVIEDAGELENLFKH